MKLTASRVAFVFSVTFASAFWMYEPKHCMHAMRAMFESSSFDIPMPSGWLLPFSFGAARLTASHVVGLSPTSPHQSRR